VTHIEDLAAYDYHHGAPEALAVGWLDSAKSFSTGSCPKEVRDKLADLAAKPVRLMRGYHYCQFCMASAPLPRILGTDTNLVEMPDVARGNGEIWITRPDGTNFAAPQLIVHYIDEHSYLPPDGFIEAVRSGILTDRVL
jgi:hypothetical protein